MLYLANGTVGIGSFKPFGERQAGLGTGLGPLIVAALVVMNESLVTRMVNDLVSQCRVPSLGTSCAAPTRLAKAQDTAKSAGPSRAEARRWRKVDASASQFRQYRFLKRLSRLGHGVHPECERSRFEQSGDRSIETWMIYCSESLNGASLLGSRWPGCGCQGSPKSIVPASAIWPVPRGANRLSSAPMSSRPAPCGGPCRRSTSWHRTSPRLLPRRIGERRPSPPKISKREDCPFVPGFGSPRIRGTETAIRIVRFGSCSAVSVMTRTHKMIMCHCTKADAPSANCCQGTTRAPCRAFCLRSRRRLERGLLCLFSPSTTRFWGRPLGLVVKAFLLYQLQCCFGKEGSTNSCFRWHEVVARRLWRGSPTG